jgi:hypothetical protein
VVAAGNSGLMSGADKTKLDGIATGATAYTDELAQDAVGAMADANSLTYTDATPLLAVKRQMSITADASGILLSGDEATPGNNKVYGTTGAGAKGWKADPAVHAAITVAADLSPLITLSTQELSFAIQNANKVLAGPATGGDADPTMRALVVADLPTVTVPYGGTGQTSYAVGDMLYASGAAVLSRLADVAAGAYLRSGGIITAPLWSTLILPNSATAYRLVVATSANTLGELAAVGATGEYLAGATGAIPIWATLNQAAVAGLTTGSSPVFVTAKLSGLTDNFFPYHVSDAVGLANSLLQQSGANLISTCTGLYIQGTGATAGIVLGLDGARYGQIGLVGNPTGSAQGGQAAFYTADDHDTTIDYFLAQAYEDDLIIGPSTDLDALKLRNDGDLLVTGGTISLSDLTDGYIPYHIDDATGLANGPVKTDVDSAVTLKHSAGSDFLVMQVFS